MRSSMKSTRRIPEISSRHCLAVLLYTNSPLVGLRQGSAGATMVQSFSENVLEPEEQRIHRGVTDADLGVWQTALRSCCSGWIHPSVQNNQQCET